MKFNRRSDRIRLAVYFLILLAVAFAAVVLK